MNPKSNVQENDPNNFELVDIEQEQDLNEIEPTAEELNTLEHISDRIPLAAWLIVVCELCERFAYYGLTGPFQNYIQFPIPGPNDKQPGALNRGHQTATLLTTFFQFFCYLTPIGGAIVADQFWGKYKATFIACIIYLIGLVVLVLSSIPPSINAGVALPGLIIAMLILGVGTGGVKSNVSPLMADQYTRTTPIIKEIKGKKKIIDPKITIQSLFNWFYWAINLGALSSLITTNIEKHHSFWLAYLIPLIVFTGSIMVLLVGRRRYIRKPPSGSLLIQAFRVTKKAIQMRRKLGKQDSKEHFLDYAKEIESSNDDIIEKGKTQQNKNQFIDDLKQALHACRVFTFYPFYWVCYNQLVGNLTSQAAQMNVGPLPNDILQNIDPFVLIVFIPLFEKIIYPSLRRFNINFKPISRITCGFICASLAMAWTALVQHLIYTTGPNFSFTTKPCSDCQKFNNITVAWQIPSYFLIAISEIFAAITGLEYAYTHAPASMKSIIMSILLFTTAIGSALNFALIPVTVDPKLLWMYTSLSIVAFAIAVIFYLIFRNDHLPQPEVLKEVNLVGQSQPQALTEQKSADQSQHQTLTEQKLDYQSHPQALTEQKSADQSQHQTLTEQKLDYQSHPQALTEQKSADQSQHQTLTEQKLDDQSHPQALTEQKSADPSQHQTLTEQKLDDQSHPQALNEQKPDDQSQSHALNEQKSADQSQPQALNEQKSDDQSHHPALTEQKSADKSQHQTLTEQKPDDQSQHQTLTEQKLDDQSQHQALNQQKPDAQSQPEP